MSFKHISFSALNIITLNDLPNLVRKWLPDGKLRGNEWIALNPTRGDKKAGSFKINIQTGRWADFATSDQGGDVISLYAYLNNLDYVDAAWALSDYLLGNGGCYE